MDGEYNKDPHESEREQKPSKQKYFSFNSMEAGISISSSWFKQLQLPMKSVFGYDVRQALRKEEN